MGNGFISKKFYNQITPEGKEPVPQPILDAKGNIDESKLSQRMPDEKPEPSDQNNKPSPPGKK